MFRIGIGEDIHRVDEERALVIGGVIIEEGPGLAGHSDADVLLHAITDAVLGAAALGDIGSHFPPSDPAHAEANSADLLRRAAGMALERGWRVSNIDSTVHTELPRLRPYVTTIEDRIAAIAGTERNNVSVKAKSAEGLDSVGRGEAMRAVAVVLLERTVPGEG
ncbi:MAG TPA: 2-C-methyl-D-erythritol 2,4-cyclodiphosphate synthase [Dehalococcoidia bacterium]|nr:2-C-methyl-D-erythritol 2,4-cyclodiphosphate synthase [Dehalococcoidia bacterium]